MESRRNVTPHDAAEDHLEEAAERRFEPWPIAVACALFLTIGVSIGFYVIAANNPDPVVTMESKPGLER